MYGLSYRWPYSPFPSTIIVASTTSARAQPPTAPSVIVITNSSKNDRLITYSVNGVRFTIKPGQSQTLLRDRPWIIEFRRGKGRDLARYALKSGIYDFQQTDYGWELFDTTRAPPASTDEALQRSDPAVRQLRQPKSE